MEIILKWVQTAILTTISALLYEFCIKRLNENNLFYIYSKILVY